MSYSNLKVVSQVSKANDGTFIITFDADCFSEEYDSENESIFSSDSDDLVLTAKTKEEVAEIFIKYLDKIKIKSPEEIFNSI